MIDVKQAVRSATEFCARLLHDEGVSGVRLEEVEFAEKNGSTCWYVTLSFKRKPETDRQKISSVLGEDEDRREYKVFTVLADTGEVRSMKVRNLVHE